MQGPEMMLKAMGLGDVLNAAQEVARSGAIQKIIKFADDLEGFQNDIAEIKRALGIGGISGSDGEQSLALSEPERAILDGATARLLGPDAAPDPADGANRDAA